LGRKGEKFGAISEWFTDFFIKKIEKLSPTSEASFDSSTNRTPENLNNSFAGVSELFREAIPIDGDESFDGPGGILVENFTDWDGSDDDADSDEEDSSEGESEQEDGETNSNSKKEDDSSSDDSDSEDEDGDESGSNDEDEVVEETDVERNLTTIVKDKLARESLCQKRCLEEDAPIDSQNYLAVYVEPEAEPISQTLQSSSFSPLEFVPNNSENSSTSSMAEPEEIASPSPESHCLFNRYPSRSTRSRAPSKNDPSQWKARPSSIPHWTTYNEEEKAKRERKRQKQSKK
jgi:hypothetical protein